MLSVENNFFMIEMDETMYYLILIAIAGALGTLSRFGLALFVQKLGGDSFPWGTMSVNLLGCLLFGLVYQLFEQKELLDPRMKLAILTGFMGAFTTFSTYAFESAGLLKEAPMLGVLNMMMQNVAGISLIVCGQTLGRML